MSNTPEVDDSACCPEEWSSPDKGMIKPADAVAVASDKSSQTATAAELLAAAANTEELTETMEGDANVESTEPEEAGTGATSTEPEKAVTSAASTTPGAAETNASGEPQSQAAALPSSDAQSNFITGFPLVCLLSGLMVAQFLVSIDRTIISTAIPYITHEFASTTDIGWYGSAYLLTACAFQPLFGRLFTLFSMRNSYLVAMLLFELGSLVCGLAPNSIALIIGRAIAGLGSAGILTGSFVVVSTAVPLQARPMYMAVVGTVFGIGATTGPLLGGVFTDLATWRWCFFVNLPAGGLTVAAMIVCFKPKQTKSVDSGIVERLKALDLCGNVLLLGAAIMLFLALEYTTQGVAWSSASVIGLLTGSGVVTIIFVVWQWWKGDNALMPPRIVLQRTVAASCCSAFMVYAALINLTYFLPIWFQAIRGQSAVESGISMIPYFVVNGAFSMAAGWFVSRVGFAMPPAVVGSALGTVGLGLMTLLRVDTTMANWVGYQVLTSIGFGISIQQGFTAVQTVLGQGDTAMATAAVVASQSLGGAVFLSVGNSVFQSQLHRASVAGGLSHLDIKAITDSGAASFRQLVPVEDLSAVLEAYNKALLTVFTLSIPLGALATIISAFIEMKSVRAVKADEETARARATPEDADKAPGD